MVTQCNIAFIKSSIFHVFSYPFLDKIVSKVRNCIELCSNSSEGACRNSCIKSYWTGPSRQNRQPDLNEEEVGSAEAVERTIPENTKHIKNLYANQPYTVTNPTAAAAYTPAPTPQGVMGQLIPFIVTALGGGEPYVKGYPGTYGQPNVNGQPYAQGQNGAGAHRQPNANGQPKPTEQPVQPTLNIPEQANMNGLPNTNSQPNMDGQPTMDNQPNVNGQPNMNDQPNMNGQPNINGQPNTNAQPNLNGQQPGANAQPTMVVPPHPPAVATDPSLLTSKLHKSK